MFVCLFLFLNAHISPRSESMRKNLCGNTLATEAGWTDALLHHAFRGEEARAHDKVKSQLLSERFECFTLAGEVSVASEQTRLIGYNVWHEVESAKGLRRSDVPPASSSDERKRQTG